MEELKNQEVKIDLSSPSKPILPVIDRKRKFLDIILGVLCMVALWMFYLVFSRFLSALTPVISILIFLALMNKFLKMGRRFIVVGMVLTILIPLLGMGGCFTVLLGWSLL